MESHVSEPLPERTGGPEGHSFALSGPWCLIVDNWDFSAWQCHEGSEFPVGAMKAEAETPLRVVGMQQQFLLWKF